MRQCETLRQDPVHQVAAGSERELASAPTLCRFENRQARATAWAVNTELVEQFIASYAQAPAVLILDFDATDTPVHGQQENRFFHGYYDCHCFLPLYVFCGDQLLTAYLRPSNIDAAKHAAAILKLLVARLRRAWPRTKFVFRADSGFCRDRLLSWCDRHDVKYVVGIARNERLLALAAPLLRRAEKQFKQTQQKQRLFTAFDYAAGSWRQVRWVIAKAEQTDKGSNPRFILTNLVGDSQKIYDRRYCQRGEMENRVKEQMMLFADRVSAHRWWTNQWRLLLSALGLHADGSAAAPGATRHGARTGDVHDDPHEADQNRRRRRHQTHRDPAAPQFTPSVAGTLLARSRRTGATVRPSALLPAPSSQWGLGAVSTDAEKLRLRRTTSGPIRKKSSA